MRFVMPVRPSLAILAGAVLTAALAVASAHVTGPAMIGGLDQAAAQAIVQAGG